MKLYTTQTLDVLVELKQYQMYKPKWELCNMDFLEPCIAEGYIWLVDQYNRIKKHDYQNPLVWWHTDLDEAYKSYKRMCDWGRTDIVLLSANVEDKEILLQDADKWEQGPMCGWPLGFRASNVFLDNDNWSEKDDKFFDSMTKAYENNRIACAETWKECLVITKQTRRIHALTPFLYLGWIEPIKKEYHLPMEM